MFRNRIKAAFILADTSMHKWAMANGFGYTQVCNVIAGRSGKLQSPITKAGQIEAALKRDGFWPTEDEPK